MAMNSITGSMRRNAYITYYIKAYVTYRKVS
jgi:hypothetical protein